ncbi:MAG: cupin-like domain-containing protein [Chroococcidiopsidaceae cyanobacterium CP_BM_RX_35]|nr:cupin-like domain-containing protein [Chroococcidiopsidaceae cyanobacterium CP_BM_RX_35]
MPKYSSGGSLEKLSDQIFQVGSVNFQEKFNHSSFQFSHNLAGHPLFELPRIAELAEKILAQGNLDNFSCFYNDGIFARSKLGAMQPKERVAKAILRIQESDSWMKLSSIQEVDSEYKALHDQIILELEELTSVPLRQEITWSSATIFFASPHTVTPYHIDHAPNFLFQIHGDKEVNLFDPSDRSILTEQEIERFYIGDMESAQYREENQSKASVYSLTPGQGVHHPGLAPHWVRNGSHVSIALSIGFCMKEWDAQSRIYQVNHLLRKIGLQPTPPGKSLLKDNLKIFSMGVFSKPKSRDQDEVIYSGIRRIKSSLKLIRQIGK